MNTNVDSVSADIKAILVGELNPYGSEPRLALYPYPEGATGDRLYRLVMAIPRRVYLKRFKRINLCTGKWSIRAARLIVDEILVHRPPAIVLLGSKVCSAFGVEFDPFTKIDYMPPIYESTIPTIILPHPSGLNRIWNKDGAFDRARKILRTTGLIENEMEVF